nr:sugar transferase [Hansschlegelia quercus]
MSFTGASQESALGGGFAAEPAVGAEPLGGGAKRAIDVVFSALAIAFLLPVFLLIILAVRASSKGPVFYGHARRGFCGATFKCLKFRTMVVNGDEVLKRHLAENPEARIEWSETRKLRNDPRVTGIGKILRKSSLDELPQLLNVLRGEMSIVGPRPVVTAELANYGDHASDYLQTRPGITGLWQISGRSDTSYAQRLAFDSEYVRTWSTAKDIRIMLLTVPAVVMQRGSV